MKTVKILYATNPDVNKNAITLRLENHLKNLRKVSLAADFIGDDEHSADLGLKWSCFSGQVCGSAKVHLGWVSCRLVQSCWFKVCVIGRSFIKSGVGSLGVVKSDPVVDDAFGLEPVLQFIQINGLLLQRAPQSLNEDVVEITAPAIHPLPGSACLYA